ncbi:MAG: DedA family protein [Rhodospirillales bacterium]|nr:DedA family protein [Rhodospirillales bacterium]
MLNRLYSWTMSLAADPRAAWWLAVIAFVESSVFPIPPDVMLVAMVLAAREKAWRFALICTVGSVIGGFLGYAIGYGLYESVGRPVLAFYHLTDSFTVFQEKFRQYGAEIILIKGLTPIPYKLVTIAAGAAHMDLHTFGLASLATRGVRFFVVASLLWKFGPPIRDFIERRLTLVTTGFLVCLVGGFVAFKFI